MKCFYHHDADAIAVCEWCGRGTCPACLQEVERRMLCSVECKDHMENGYREYYAQKEAADRSDRSHVQLGRAHRIFGLINVALGYMPRLDAAGEVGGRASQPIRGESWHHTCSI